MRSKEGASLNCIFSELYPRKPASIRVICVPILLVKYQVLRYWHCKSQSGILNNQEI